MRDRNRQRRNDTTELTTRVRRVGVPTDPSIRCDRYGCRARPTHDVREVAGNGGVISMRYVCAEHAGV